MGLFDDLEKNVGGYLWGVGLKRTAAAIGGYIAGTLAAPKAAAWFAAHGVTVDPVVVQKSVVGAVTAGSVWLHDWLRTKTEIGWL